MLERLTDLKRRYCSSYWRRYSWGVAVSFSSSFALRSGEGFGTISRPEVFRLT